jgi:hypothetical protein
MRVQGVTILGVGGYAIKLDLAPATIERWIEERREAKSAVTKDPTTAIA